MQRAACLRNGTGLQASARPARGDPVSFVVALMNSKLMNTKLPGSDSPEDFEKN
ncbi:hypothetical protein MCEGEM3_01697 [Oxalobacteraceae bacterium]